jgi:hypothetical protein
MEAVNGSRAQVHQVVRPEWRPKALLAQALEILPAWGTGILLQDIIPLLGGARQVKGGEPDLVDIASTLGVENCSHWLIQLKGSSLPSYVGNDSLWNLGTLMPVSSSGSSGIGGGMCMAAVGSGGGMWMADAMEGTGDGECGKGICVIGSGSGWVTCCVVTGSGVGTWLSMGSVVPIGAVGTMAAVVITRAEVTGGGAAVVVVAEEAMAAAEEMEPDISDTRLLELGLLRRK